MKVAQLTSGASFGEMALLYSTVRTATIRCASSGTCFRLGRAAYLLAVRDAPEGAPEMAAAGASKDPSPNGQRRVGRPTQQSDVENAGAWLFEMINGKLQQNLLKTVQEVRAATRVTDPSPAPTNMFHFEAGAQERGRAS